MSNVFRFGFGNGGRIYMGSLVWGRRLRNYVFARLYWRRSRGLAASKRIFFHSLLLLNTQL